MRASPDNPESNQLPKGMDEKGLIEAIEGSGYPLQGEIASILVSKFDRVVEEWGYIDRDTGEHRSLDLVAHRSFTREGAARVCPSLVLLIECKRSQHPYLFFQSVPNHPIPQFPRIMGLPNGRIWIYEKGSNRSTDATGAMAFGLDTLPFVVPGPPKCATFTKAVPKGNKAELSGADPFNSLVQPLGKALVHAADLYKAREKPERIFPTLGVAVSVVDAPMLLVDKPEAANDPVLVPWVRVVRQEANPDPHSWDRYRFYCIDIVHAAFFGDYVSNHVLPFVEEFATRAMQLTEVIFRGGRVSDLHNWEWSDIEPTLP